MADIREEDFTRLQAQIIELRTTSYEAEIKCQRQNTELEQLKEKTSQLEKELEKSNKIIQRSKNKKEYALLLDENEGLQHQLQDHEEDFKLQNRTLLEEVARIEDENKKLLEEIKNLKLRKDGDNSGSFHEAELRRLKAENSALQKSLKTTQELYEAELSKDKETASDISGSGEQNENTGKCEDTVGDKDENESEELIDTTQDKQLQEDNIEDEFARLITSAFQSFCTNVDKNRETDETENSGQVTGDESVLDEDKTHCCQFSDKELESLQENIVKEIHVLLQAKKMCSRQTSVKSECSERNDESVAHLKYSAQLTEIQLNLATEREEKKLLEEQLQDLEDNLRKEISRLKEEVEKLTEKAKRKQESFTQLQEEKENLYNENRKTVNDLKHSYDNKIQALTDQITQITQNLEASKKEIAESQQIAEEKIKELNEKLVLQESQATSNVEETIQELDNTRIENSSLNEQLQSLHEACESYRIENEDQKVMIIGLQDQLKEMEKAEAKLKCDNEKVKSDLEEAALSYEHLRRQVDEMMNEKEQYLQSTNEATKLAEKRKQLLDEYSISQQETITQHKEEMENMETSYKEAAKKKQEEFKKTIEDLKAQLQGEKKLKKELEEKQQHFLDVSTQLSATESKSGWFERRLAETEEILNDEREKAQQTVEDLKEKHELHINELSTKHSGEVESLNEKILAVEGERKEQLNLIEKFKQELKDKDVENVIAGKKGDHLVKDLKRQLRAERKKSELLQQRLQEAASENRARENFEKIFDPNISKEITRRNSGDSSMLSGSSLTFDNQEYKESSPDTSINTSVNDETVDLISRVADVQQEKWLLEEREKKIVIVLLERSFKLVRHLEGSCSAMAEDLMQKSTIIQHYAMDTKIDIGKDATNVPESNFKTRMKDTFNIGKQDDLRKIINKKLQIMLEETLMKNIELQKAVDSLSKENSSLDEGHFSQQTREPNNR